MDLANFPSSNKDDAASRTARDKKTKWGCNRVYNVESYDEILNDYGKCYDTNCALTFRKKWLMLLYFDLNGVISSTQPTTGHYRLYAFI